MSPALAGIHEVAEILGVSIRTAHRYVNRPDFPTPVDELATGRIWRRVDVERFAKRAARPARGRPPSPKLGTD